MRVSGLLVLGPPGLGVDALDRGVAIARQRPSVVHIAIEIKSVMTEHRKAVKNRKRDLEALHEHVHNYNNQAIAGGVLVINGASTFKSPLRCSPTAHRNPAQLVEHCLKELRAVAARGGPTGYGLEAKCALVVDIDNLNRRQSKYLRIPAAPSTGDPLHYDAFIRTVCDHYVRRF